MSFTANTVEIETYQNITYKFIRAVVTVTSSGGVLVTGSVNGTAAAISRFTPKVNLKRMMIDGKKHDFKSANKPTGNSGNQRPVKISSRKVRD